MAKQCVICGAWFTPQHGNSRQCPECVEALQKGKGRGLPRDYDAPSDLETYERRIRERYMERYRDTIVAIGYAERQMAETLKKAGKVNTNL